MEAFVGLLEGYLLSGGLDLLVGLGSDGGVGRHLELGLVLREVFFEGACHLFLRQIINRV